MSNLNSMRALKQGMMALPIAVALSVTVCAQKTVFSARKQQALKADPVIYLFPEQVTVSAAKPASVALHFRVAPGLHINSHTPTDEFLIPTVFSIPADSGAKLASVVYPPGTMMALPIDPTTKLSVYTGEFIIQAHMIVSEGNHLVQGQLRYQACDNNQCLPPKTIPVAIDVIGR